MNAKPQPAVWVRRLALSAVSLLVLVALAGCVVSRQSHSTTQSQSIDLQPGVLASSGIAFITPNSFTGQEEDIQALALAFTEALREQRPTMRVMSLPETLSSINRAGLARDYRQMFEDYQLTGILERDTLRKVGEVIGVRYLAQLKLGAFRQESSDRWKAAGLRLVETKTTSLRLYLQIWDADHGTIAWEGGQELTTAHDSIREKSIPFNTAVRQSAVELIARLPQ